jgi:hypothetical protein
MLFILCCFAKGEEFLRMNALSVDDSIYRECHNYASKEISPLSNTMGVSPKLQTCTAQDDAGRVQMSQVRAAPTSKKQIAFEDKLKKLLTESGDEENMAQAAPASTSHLCPLSPESTAYSKRLISRTASVNKNKQKGQAGAAGSAPISDINLRMNRSVSTVPELWREWYKGIDGSMAIAQRDYVYGNRWRRVHKEYVYYASRKKLIEAVWEFAKDKGWKGQEAMEHFEKTRLKHGKSLYYMAYNLKEILRLINDEA